MKKQILVADEDQLILYGLAKSFKDDRYEVKTASTATAAIKKLSHCSYDLCLLDVHLADSNDQRLMKMIQDICPETKIILMAASYLDSPELSEDNFEAITNGSCYFISKPFELCEVHEVVHRVLTGEENFFTDYRFISNGFEKKSRKHPRKCYIEKIPFQMSVIENGVPTRWSLEAKSVDISGSGIGLLSRYPLEKSQIIGFDEEMGNRTGVVVWSIMIDEENCRVGLEFV
jgi:DNA-binding response OmpR family regulator